MNVVNKEVYLAHWRIFGGLLKGLKEIHLLDEDFEYELTLQTGDCHIDTETLEETEEVESEI